MGKLFGTDGIRGVVNAGLDADLAYKVGLAAAEVLAKGKQPGEKPLVTIGKDTRISGDLLKGSLIAGLCTAGPTCWTWAPCPPRRGLGDGGRGADAGIVISASHNPFEHNGIKIFNGQGFKLSDELEEKIEEIVLFGHNNVPRKTHGEIGKVSYVAPKGVRGLHRPPGSPPSTPPWAACASWWTVPMVPPPPPPPACSTASPSCAPTSSTPTRTGSTSTKVRFHPHGRLGRHGKGGGYDIGIAFDGDADRCLAVDERGELIDGDQIMAACGLDMKRKGKLPGNAVVATVMSNLGLHLFAKEHGMDLECTSVGDRNVLERMLEKGYAIGGEQSGHMIFLEHATTGDGQLTALQVLALLKESGKQASEVFGICQRYPQVLINIPVADNDRKKAVMASQALADAVAAEEEKLAGEGRVLVRPSGTEALMRVMVEARDQDTAQAAAQRLADQIAAL